MTPPLLAVTLVYRSKARFSSLPHVIGTTTAFLDSSVELELRRAVQFNSIRLLDRIWSSSSPDNFGPGKWSRRKYLRTDAHYSRHQFRVSMLEAVRQPGMEMVQWLYDHFYGCVVSNQVVEEVARQGNLKMLKFFYHHMIPWEFSDGRSVRPNGELEPSARHFVQWGRRDMASAAENGQLEVLYWLHEQTEAPCDIPQLIQSAVEIGEIQILEWIQGNFNFAAAYARNLMDEPAVAGRLDVMKWLRSHGCVKNAHMAIYGAVKNGHLDVVNWMLKHKLVEAARALDAATTRGRLEIARSIYKRFWSKIRADTYYPLEQPSVPHFLRNTPLWICGSTMLATATNGHLEAVRWLIEAFADDPDVNLFDDKLPPLDGAAANGHLEVVKYLHELSLLFASDSGKKRKRGGSMQSPGPICTTAAIDRAAANNHFDVVQWLFSNRSEGFTDYATVFAAANGHLQMVQWLHSRKPESCSSEAMVRAAQNGHLEVVKWLSSHAGIEFTTQAMDDAASGGHLELVKWLHTNGAKCTTDAMDGAGRDGKLEMVKWLNEHRTEGCTSDAMDLAAEEGHFEVVQWLHANRDEGCTTVAMDGAALCCDFDLVLFLHSQRNEGCTERALYGTEEEEEDAENVNMWFREHYPEIIPRTADREYM